MGFSFANGRVKPRTQYGKGGKRADLGGLYVRSSMEANWARYLNFLVANKQIKSWTYESEEFEFAGIKRGCRTYKSDFVVILNDGSKEYHETKGYMDQKSRTKLKRMAKYHPEVQISLVDVKRYRAVADHVSGLIPGWE